MSALRHASIVRINGKVENGRLVVPKKLRLPNCQVEITVSEKRSPKKWKKGLTRAQLLKHPFFGMWKDRPEMDDSAEYVAKLRAREDARSARD